VRNEDGIWCDIRAGNGKPCGKLATYVHSCAVEGSEFAMCKGHENEWKGKTAGKPEQQTRCPRCLPLFIAQGGGRVEAAQQDHLGIPVTGPLAEAFSDAMFKEGILSPTRERVLKRLGATDDSYVKAIFRSTARQDPQTQSAQSPQPKGAALT
jgi:hypothetical protein